MLRNLITVCKRTAEGILRVSADNVFGNDDAKQQCFGEWPLESLSSNNGSFIYGTPGHWGLLTCLRSWEQMTQIQIDAN